jgi:hypothetical protein
MLIHRRDAHLPLKPEKYREILDYFRNHPEPAFLERSFRLVNSGNIERSPQNVGRGWIYKFNFAPRFLFGVMVNETSIVYIKQYKLQNNCDVIVLLSDRVLPEIQSDEDRKVSEKIIYIPINNRLYTQIIAFENNDSPEEPSYNVQDYSGVYSKYRDQVFLSLTFSSKYREWKQRMAKDGLILLPTSKESDFEKILKLVNNIWVNVGTGESEASPEHFQVFNKIDEETFLPIIKRVPDNNTPKLKLNMTKQEWLFIDRARSHEITTLSGIKIEDIKLWFIYDSNAPKFEDACKQLAEILVVKNVLWKNTNGEYKLVTKPFIADLIKNKHLITLSSVKDALKEAQELNSDLSESYTNNWKMEDGQLEALKNELTSINAKLETEEWIDLGTSPLLEDTIIFESIEKHHRLFTRFNKVLANNPQPIQEINHAIIEWISNDTEHLEIPLLVKATVIKMAAQLWNKVVKEISELQISCIEKATFEDISKNRITLKSIKSEVGFVDDSLRIALGYLKVPHRFTEANTKLAETKAEVEILVSRIETVESRWNTILMEVAVKQVDDSPVSILSKQFMECKQYLDGSILWKDEFESEFNALQNYKIRSLMVSMENARISEIEHQLESILEGISDLKQQLQDSLNDAEITLTSKLEAAYYELQLVQKGFPLVVQKVPEIQSQYEPVDLTSIESCSTYVKKMEMINHKSQLISNLGVKMCSHNSAWTEYKRLKSAPLEPLTYLNNEQETLKNRNLVFEKKTVTYHVS